MSLKVLVIVEKTDALTERFIYREVEELRRIGYHVTILGLNECSSNPRVNFKDVTKIIRSNYFNPLKLLQYILPILNSYHSTEKPDLIISHFATIAAFLGVALARLWDIPHFCSVHANDIFVPADYGIKSIERGNEIITCSKAGFDKVKELTGTEGNLNLFYHGLKINDYEYSPESERKKCIIYAGRLCKKKGLSFLLKGFKIFTECNRDFVLKIFGNGPEKDKLFALAESLSLSDNLVFEDFLSQKELTRTLSESFLLCHPSVIAPDGDMDGIPNIILEAMAIGTPVLSSNKVGGIPEVIIDNENGFLSEPENPQSIADKLNLITAGTIDLKKITDNARNLIEDKFDISKNIINLDRLLKKYIK